MSDAARAHFDNLLRLARQADNDSLGRLLEAYRHYLRLLARLQVGCRLQGKADASDLLQETFLQAHRSFDGFRGTTEAELLQWRKSILVSKLTKLVRHFFTTQRRDVRLESELDEELDRSSQVAQVLVSSQSSPSRKATRREEAVLVADALAQLPEDHREVIILRHFEELSFPKVAQRMGKSVSGTERLWMRALATLRQMLGAKVDVSR